MEEKMRIVEFGEYCDKCKHADKSESEDPCWDCLSIPAREGSSRPEYFEEK